MRRLDFYEYDMDTDEEIPLYSLILNDGKITASNEEGEKYLSYMEEGYDLGITHRDVRLYGEGKYEELFNLLERAARNPNFYVKIPDESPQ